MASARPYHHGNLRAELLDAAERTLRARGPGELSLRELAREVGVSHAAPRRHFADRQALLDALAEAGFDRLGAALTVGLADAGPGFAERLSALGRAYVRFASEHRALVELMFTGKHRDGATGVQAAAARALAAPRAIFTEALGEDEGDRAALVVFATLQGLATFANGGLIGQDLDTAVDEAVERLVRGLPR